MVAHYPSSASFSLRQAGPRARLLRWAAACLLPFVIVAGARTANAASLDDAAERYRPYVIEGIGQALAGALDLRKRISEKDLAGA